MAARVEIKRLSKSFGSLRAVDDVSFVVEQGEVLGFLGPNGAGKSTTMKMLTGFLTPTSGTAEVCGHDVLEQPLAVKRALGYLPEGAPSYGEMTPASFLEFVAEVRGFRGKDIKDRVSRARGLAQLEGVMGQRIETLSKGYRRRVGIAQAILHDPAVLVLDEPTDGLDPNQKHEVRNLIRDMGKDKVIILSTHILEEVDAVCTRAIIIAKGRVLADGTPAELLDRGERSTIHVSVRASDPTSVHEMLEAIDGVEGLELKQAGGGLARFHLHARKGADIIPLIGRRVHESDWELDELHLVRARLDEVFRDITTGAESNGAGS